VPTGCKIELVASFSRHGSRYPDTGAYNQWLDLQKRIQAAGAIKVTDKKLEFLKTWKPVLSYPERQIAQISPTGYEELTSMGATWRLRYPDLYEYNTPFDMWSNYYVSVGVRTAYDTNTDFVPCGLADWEPPCSRQCAYVCPGLRRA
jgi:acid phosphatase